MIYSKNDIIKSLLGDTVFYGVISALSKMASLIIVPIVLRALSINEYGQYDKMLVLLGTLSTIVILGQDSAIATYYFQVESATKKGTILYSSLCLQTLALIIVFTGFIIFDRNNTTDLLISILFCVGFVLHNFSRNIFKWAFNKKNFAFVSIGQIIFVLIAVLFFKNKGNLTPNILLTISGFSYFLFGSLGIFLLREKIGNTFDLNVSKKLLKVGLPLGLVSIITVASMYIEREAVMVLSDSYILGTYSASLKVVLPISLINLAIGTSWPPIFFSLTKDVDRAKKFELVYIVISSIVIGCQACLFFYGSKFLILLSGSQYSFDEKILLIMITTVVYDILASNLQLGMIISEKSLGIFIVYAASLIVSLVVIILFSSYKEYSVAFGFLSGAVLRTLIIRDYSNKNGKMKQSLIITIIPMVLFGLRWYVI